MQPLIHIGFPGDIVAWQQIGFFAVLHVAGRVDGTQARHAFLLVERFGSIGDHHVSFFVQQLLKDGLVVMKGQRRLWQMSASEGFIGATGRFDQTHRGLVDLLDSLIQGLIGAADQRDFAIDVQRVAEKRFFLAFQAHRDATHTDVAFTGHHVRHQVFPRRGHPLHVHPQALGQ